MSSTDGRISAARGRPRYGAAWRYGPEVLAGGRGGMRVGISGAHGTGKTTLVEALCEQLAGHVATEEPYYLLEEAGYDFRFPPSRDDYRTMLECSVRLLCSPVSSAGTIFDRTPLDQLAYLAATGANPARTIDGASLRPAFASLDLLVITAITRETELALPPAELPALRSRMNDALLELLYDDPFDAWGNAPVLELDGPLDGRLDAVLDALANIRQD